MNLLFVAVQPLLLRAFYWRELMGQVIVTIPFGNSIDQQHRFFYVGFAGLQPGYAS